MMESPISRATRRVAAAVSALAAALVLASGAAAQSVAFLEYGISVHNLSGPTVSIDAFGTINLGANGTGGNLRLRDTDGSLRVDLLGGTADLIVGGGDDDGDIVLRDTDGVTTTVNLQGEFGFVQLGSPNEDGDLRLWDNDPVDEFSINLDGATGNVTNQLGGNGLVKAWAKVNANGSIHSCWRCTGQVSLNNTPTNVWYYVEFVEAYLNRPRLAVLDGHGSGESSGQIDISGGVVRTRNSSGDAAQRGFTLLVF